MTIHEIEGLPLGFAKVRTFHERKARLNLSGLSTASPLRPRTGIRGTACRPGSAHRSFDASFAAAGLPLLATACSGDSPLSSIPGVVLFVIAAPVALLAMRFLARVDSFWLCGGGVVTSALGGLILGAIGLGSAQTNPLALLGAAACGGIFAACVRQRSRIQRGLVEDPVPNKLVQRFGKEAIREFEGVQVVVTAPQTVRPGESRRSAFICRTATTRPATSS